MKKSPLLRRAALLAAACHLALAAGHLPAAFAAAEGPVVCDFDKTTKDLFSFKDEKGTVFNVSGAYTDAKRGKHLGIRYNIVSEGWGGCGLGLKNLDASRYKYLSFELKGEKGGENFEIGLKDKAGQERKAPISQYADVSRQWQRVLVPLSDFAGVNLAALDNVNFGFNERQRAGTVFFDNFQLEGGAGAQSDGLAADPTLTSKSLVDGFERTSPFDAYQVFQGDDSSLGLSSSRIVHDGDYSMELEYKFSTTRPWGSWVSAIRHLRDPLDWTGVQDVKLWVKGDGSENALRVRFTEADGESWEYVDADALRSTRWTLLTMPVARFELVSPTGADGKQDLSRIASYQIDVLSPTSQATSGSKTTLGRIQVDQFYVSGERVRAAQSAPREADARGGAPASLGNVDFTVNAFTEYFLTPEEKSQVNHHAKLVTNAKLGNYSARVEIGSVSQEFGQASAFVGVSTQANSNRFPEVEMPSFQVMSNNVSPYLTNVTIGNLFVDYSPYTFSGVFGYKGISAEGDYDRFNYHAFALKHVLNSFSAGSRVRAIWPWLKLTGYGVYWEENARVANAGAVANGTLNQPTGSTIRLQRVAQDMVYNLEGETKLLSDRLTLQALHGYNRYNQTAAVDRTDPFNPLYSNPLDPSLRRTGEIFRVKAEADGLLWRGLNMAYLYRDVGTFYKPHYRQNPVSFDDTESDQWGHNVRVTQFHKGWVLSNEYDAIRRNSARRYFRHRYNWGLGHYGYRGVDVAFSQEYRREIYAFTSDRSIFAADKNDYVIASELYVRTQLSPRLAFWVKPRNERIWQPVPNKKYHTDILQMKLEFYITTNARLFGEHKLTRTQQPEFEPQGFPFDDNFTRVTFEVNF